MVILYGFLFSYLNFIEVTDIILLCFHCYLAGYSVMEIHLIEDMIMTYDKFIRIGIL